MVPTCNSAELLALIHAVQHVLDHPPPSHLRIVLLVDNTMALKVAACVHGSRAYPRLAAQLQGLTREMESTHKVLYEWSPGHAGWALNEWADALAKRGAAGVTSSAPITVTQDAGSDHEAQIVSPASTVPSASADSSAARARFSLEQPSSGQRVSPLATRKRKRERPSRKRYRPSGQSPRRSARKRQSRSGLFPGLDFSLSHRLAPTHTNTHSNQPHTRQTSRTPPHQAQPPGRSAFSNLLNWIESFTPPQ